MSDQENKQQGSNKTPKSLWRSKRGEENDLDFTSWQRRLDAYIKRVNPKQKETGRLQKKAVRNPG